MENGITKVGSYAFLSDSSTTRSSNLSSLTIPDSVETINGGQYEDFEMLSLSSVTISPTALAKLNSSFLGYLVDYGSLLSIDVNNEWSQVHYAIDPNQTDIAVRINCQGAAEECRAALVNNLPSYYPEYYGSLGSLDFNNINNIVQTTNNSSGTGDDISGNETSNDGETGGSNENGGEETGDSNVGGSEDTSESNVSSNENQGGESTSGSENTSGESGGGEISGEVTPSTPTHTIKRIYTTEEAAALSKKTGNTFRLRYK
ncbi:MAG: hypothetical protein IJ870_06690 [Alphaproteobacteria bacterium]|nr:hypothetical protein [Alphaproteobacteria bacterium]